MLLRRLLLVIAVLMAMTAVTVALSPRERGGATTTGTVASPPPAAPVAGDVSPSEREGQAPGEAPLETLRAQGSGQVVRIDIGERLRLRVVSDTLESVQLGEDGPIEAVDPDSPAEFEILAEPGLDAQVRLLESGRPIGRVVAQP